MVKQIMDTVDTYSNLDDCWEDLEEALIDLLTNLKDKQ